MATVERVRIYPVKALDGEECESARVTDAGLLAGDREYALVGPDGDPVNGKRTARVHDVTTDFDRETGLLTARYDGDRREFALPDEREAAADWFGSVFDLDVSIRRDATRGFVDRRSAGPSVVSTATLRTVASWYDDATVAGMRRRLRANVEVGGVEPFWEDRFVGADAPDLAVGGVRLAGTEPCVRCVVPERDPDTGEHDPSFRERFVRRRRETMPDWADADAFDTDYAVMLIASVPPGERGGEIRVGDEVRAV